MIFAHGYLIVLASFVEKRTIFPLINLAPFYKINWSYLCGYISRCSIDLSLYWSSQQWGAALVTVVCRKSWTPVAEIFWFYFFSPTFIHGAPTPHAVPFICSPTHSRNISGALIGFQAWIYMRGHSGDKIYINSLLSWSLQSIGGWGVGSWNDKQKYIHFICPTHIYIIYIHTYQSNTHTVHVSVVR